MQVKAANNATVFSIREFLGLNENPDGVTTLKNGEMSEMWNFRITQDKHLQLRPGTETVLDLAAVVTAAGGTVFSTDRIFGLWRGDVAGATRTLVSFAGCVLNVVLDPSGAYPHIRSARVIGTCARSETTFFGFGNKVYLLDGTNYKSWDGGPLSSFADVTPYVPIVQTATTPGGSGTMLENVNRLTNRKRVQFSPDGTADTFQLPEKDVIAVYKVTLNGTETTAYTANVTAGTVTMTSVPAAGVNTLEVTYAKGADASAEVKAMRYSELYNGATDTRVFLYGDRTNRTIYSGVEYSTGNASAEYFPDLYEVTIGEKNTPVTALVRHYSRLMAFKPNSAYVVNYGTITLANGATTAAFYVTPVNRQFGNEAPGQVHLLENNPLTLDAGSVYQWKSTGYSTYISSNENNAKRVSERVERTLRRYKLETIKTVNIKHEHEYWFLLGGGAALILNYGNDTWYLYTGLPFNAPPVEVTNEIYGFCDNGKVVQFALEHRSDDGTAIDAYAATGAMDFDRDWLLKYSPMLYVAMQPQSNARIYVTVESNRRSDYPDKLVAYGLANFLHADFRHWSFGTNNKPQVKRVKMKVKKATFYRLIFKSNSASAAATIIETNIKLRYAGSVK